MTSAFSISPSDDEILAHEDHARGSFSFNANGSANFGFHVKPLALFWQANFLHVSQAGESNIVASQESGRLADTVTRPSYTPTDSIYRNHQYHIYGTSAANIQTEKVWDDYTGRGIKVGVIDDGFDYNHRDLSPNYARQWDYDFLGRDEDAYYDVNAGDAHGTATMGLIGAANNGYGAVGVAYDAHLIGYRVGFGTYGSTLSDFGQALASQRTIDISNNSWGFVGAFSDDFRASYFNPISSGLYQGASTGRGGLGTIYVFAGGNSGASGDSVNYHNLQNSIYAIAVGAVDRNGIKASFSTPGDALLVSAAGVGVATTDAVAGGYVSGEFVSASGTSFSAPIVSGVVALMLDANERLGYRDVQEILALSATRNDASNSSWKYNGAENWNGGGMHFNSNYGFGAVNAHAAVRLAETWREQNSLSDMIRVETGAGAGGVVADDPAATFMASLNVTSRIQLDKVGIYLDILSPNNQLGDMQVQLISPDGTASTLIDRINNGNYQSGRLIFNMSSNAFWGEETVGTWQLKVTDAVRGNGMATVNGWGLTFYGDAVSTSDTYFYTNEYGAANANHSAGRSILRDTDGGVDTLNAATVTSSSLIDLLPGANSLINNSTLTIDARTIIENAIGGDGADRIYGNNGINRLEGWRGNDDLYGRGGSDELYGGAGDDRLFGEFGNDILVGGIGRDTLVGGVGQDIFRFTALADAGDQINDFTRGLDKLDFKPLMQSINYTGINAVADKILEFRINGNHTDILVDADGVGTQSSVLLATVLNVRTPFVQGTDYFIA